MNSHTKRERYKPNGELFKYDGVLWEVIQKEDQISIAGATVICTNCYHVLDEKLKCPDCKKQHSMSTDVSTGASGALQSYLAQKRRQEYKVVVPQVGEKIAEADLQLPDNRFMNARLENRKGVDQVVITVGRTDQSKKAQIFVDLSKNEIRHDQTNDEPAGMLSRVELKHGEQANIKEYIQSDKMQNLEHPYVYVNGSAYSHWADGASLSLNLKSDESDEYFLEHLEIDGFTAEPQRSISPKAITKGIVINGEIMPFSISAPKLKMILRRGNNRYLVEQNIITSPRAADEKFEFQRWVEEPALIKKLDSFEA